MSKEKVLTIAVPSYNMQDYLPRCLESLIVPEGMDEMEVLVVNDGSKDNTLFIAREYQQRYPNTFKAIDKPNGNWGSCVNVALKQASGKYFRMLDADDWFDTRGFLEYLLKLKKVDVDLVITDLSIEYDNNKKSRFRKAAKNNIIPDKIYEFKNNDNTLLKLIDVGMASATYQTKILRDIKLECTENIFYADLEYIFYTIKHIRTYMYINIILYRYYQMYAGRSTSYEGTIRNRNSLYIIIKNMLLYTRNHRACVFQKKYLKNALITYYHTILCLQNKNSKDNRRLKEIDVLLESIDKKLYTELYKLRDLRIFKYVGLWRQRDKFWGESKTRKIIDKLRKELQKCLKKIH
jgi:glycosyltransferase involved in cell wall biosynthesis